MWVSPWFFYRGPFGYSPSCTESFHGVVDLGLELAFPILIIMEEVIKEEEDEVVVQQIIYAPVDDELMIRRL